MPAQFSLAQDLFTYGSLMCEDIMAEVAGVRLPFTAATLRGYQRFSVKDEHYPGVVPCGNGLVPGIVYHRITPACWSRLDRFEGAMYNRCSVTVHYENGVEALVDCYVFRPECTHRLTATEWDYAAFLENGKAIFHQQYCGFKAID
jgi:gamma-glutamylcyclotransferase (GGCT)/AIG2-like uncharacterized protein YtfP